MKTVLIYVLGANMHPYPMLMLCSMATWDSVQPDGTQTYYYTSPVSFNNARIKQFNVPEGYHMMGHKNLVAYDWALKNLQWDYMARVNASTYVRKKALVAYCQSIPETGLIRGVVAGDPANGGFMWGGANYLMSRDVVQKLVDHRSQWDHSIMEDMAVSKLAMSLGIQLDKYGRACSMNRKNDGRWLCIWYADGKSGGCEGNWPRDFKRAAHFVRVKQDGNRNLDCDIMRELWTSGIC